MCLPLGEQKSKAKHKLGILEITVSPIYIELYALNDKTSISKMLILKSHDFYLHSVLKVSIYLDKYIH